MRLSSGPMLEEEKPSASQFRTRRAHIRTLLPQLASNKTTRPTYKLVRKHCDSSQLNTFVALTEKASALHVTNLRNRLIISLSQNLHDLRTTRFFLLVKSTKNLENSFGFLYFRQDQLHIDLFVFFSVFFSCFFLFLAFCIVLWRLKSSFDMRRARERHAVELMNMAQRPFASHTVQFSKPNEICLKSSKLLENSASLPQTKRPLSKRLKEVKNSSEEAINLLPINNEPPVICINPLAIEPLSVNHISVATVLVQMPQNQSLSFGCVLTPHQFSTE